VSVYGFDLAEKAISSADAVAQNAVMFCLQAETLPVFAGWLESLGVIPDGDYSVDSVRDDLLETARQLDDRLCSQ